MEKRAAKKRRAHLFQPGQSGNPAGRKKGSTNRYSIGDLSAGIKKVEKKKHRKFIEVWVESAWGDATAMSRIAKFMLPELKSIEGVIATFESSMSDELAKAIQDELKSRYEK